MSKKASLQSAAKPAFPPAKTREIVESMGMGLGRKSPGEKQDVATGKRILAQVKGR